jgi:hypothetical protein
MKTVSMWVMLILPLVFVNAACSTRQGYTSVQEYQRNVCNQITDFQERQHCLERISATYDTYQRQSDEVKSPR